MKLERRSKIIELIGKYQIETQEELGERLEQEGFTVTAGDDFKRHKGVKTYKGCLLTVFTRNTHFSRRRRQIFTISM